MLDVVPPSPGQVSRPRRTKRRPIQASTATPAVPRVGPRVVTLNWRLPARLRRPIRQELARARRQKKQEQSIVHFERRSIYTELPTTRPNYSQPAAPSSAVEQHTADIYKNSRATIGLPVPPYRGRVARSSSPAPIARRPVTSRPAVPARAPQQAPRQAAQRTPDFFADNIRDVPYQWQQGAAAERPAHHAISLADAQKLLRPIEKPKRRFALPLHVSVFPWRKNTQATAADGKKKI